MKWEYQALKLDIPRFESTDFEKSIETQLNRQGEQGWELVSVIKIEYSARAVIFKKPVEN